MLLLFVSPVPILPNNCNADMDENPPFGDYKFISSAVHTLALFATQLKLLLVAVLGSWRAFCLYCPAYGKHICSASCLLSTAQHHF